MLAIPDLFKKNVRGTEKEAIVPMVQAFLCSLTKAVADGIGCECKKVYFTTRVIKHVYDKRPAQEFDFLLYNVHTIVKYPDKVFKNRGGKRGDFAFMKELKNKKHLVLLEVVIKDGTTYCELTTFFTPDEDYLKKFELLWEWKGGNLHRDAFDSGVTQPSSTLQ